MRKSANSPQQRLREALRARAQKLAPELGRLSDAVWDNQEFAISHEQCLASLPSLVHAEAVGKQVASMFPAIKHHLDYCESCGAVYVPMLEMAIADLADQMVQVPASLVPDLSFLQAKPALRVRFLVQDLARNLLRIISSEDVADVDVIADTFFELAKNLHGEIFLNPQAAPALALTTGELTPALQALALVYATARDLENNVTSQQIDEWSRQQRLRYELELRIRAIGSEIGLNPKTAPSFVSALAAELARDPALLVALIQPV